MITIVEVRTKKQQKLFIEFPLKLYKNNPYFVPPLYLEEKKLFKNNYCYYDACKAAYFLAYKDGVLSGRISAIIQTAANEKTGEKRVRFTRFDCFDDLSVSAALFKAVENYAAQNGMDTVCGPLGFSDLEREGLLVEGFEELSTFEEQYNYPYYAKLIENAGFVKEKDWVESKIYSPEDARKKLRVKRAGENVLKLYNLHFGKAKNINEFIKKYGDKFFEILDKTYADIYGFVPFTENMKRELIKNFKLIVSVKTVCVILDESETPVCFGLCFPSIARAVQKSGGRLTPACLIRLLKAIKKPEIIDFGLIGVVPEYRNAGLTAAMLGFLYDIIESTRLKYGETNLNLEDNLDVINQWKHFDSVRHKRRRAYVKKIGE